MAHAQAFPAYAPTANKGTLMPGQTIAVNKYTVQVERYLSQGWLFILRHFFKDRCDAERSLIFQVDLRMSIL